MNNPGVVEVWRGDRVESSHRGAGAVVDSAGGLVFAFGDIERPIYPRSAVKAFQALPLIESGAADRMGFSVCPEVYGPNDSLPELARNTLSDETVCLEITEKVETIESSLAQ